MKSTLILILLFLNLFCWGQQRIPAIEYSLLDPSNQWSILNEFEAMHIHPNDPYSYLKSSWYKIGNDTSINSIIYKKLMQSTDLDHIKWKVSGQLRKDGERIYSLDGNREFLLYDFGLEVGDSISSAIVQGFNYISRLDSIRDTTMQNSVRKIYYFSEFPSFGHDEKIKEVWIEGIGSVTDGLLRKTLLGWTGNNGSDYSLLCFLQNENLIYHSENYGSSCFIDYTTPKHLVSTNKLWSTMAGPVFGCPSSFFCSSYFTQFAGDTLIGGTHYLNVMRSEDHQMQNWITEGYIREDNTQKVYFRERSAKSECLLYDFGCQVGDTLNLDCGCIGKGYLVDSIKTIGSSGYSMKYFYLTYLEYGTKEVWIEGIGSTMGILNGGAWGHCLTGGSMGEALLCYYDSGIIKYQSSEFPNFCYLSPEIIDGIEPEKAISQFNVYPNPVSGELFIRPTSKTVEAYTLEMYSVKGELLKTECLELGNSLHRIGTSSLRNGIYILRLISDSGKYDEKVIVKE
jgi:hypothetical protein